MFIHLWIIFGKFYHKTRYEQSQPGDDPPDVLAEICSKNNWQFMILLKEEGFPSVMIEFKSLCILEKKNHNHAVENLYMRQHFDKSCFIPCFFTLVDLCPDIFPGLGGQK